MVDCGTGVASKMEAWVYFVRAGTSDGAHRTLQDPTSYLEAPSSAGMRIVLRCMDSAKVIVGKFF